jgi:hypothetical protein
MDRTEVYAAIDSERDWQDRKWGTIQKHPHEVGAWLTILRKLLADAERSWVTSTDDRLALDEVRQVAAVAVACCEQHGVRERSKWQEMERKRL